MRCGPFSERSMCKIRKSLADDVGTWRDLFSGQSLPRREIEDFFQAEIGAVIEEFAFARLGSDDERFFPVASAMSFNKRALGASQSPSMRRDGSFLTISSNCVSDALSYTLQELFCFLECFFNAFGRFSAGLGRVGFTAAATARREGRSL